MGFSEISIFYLLQDDYNSFIHMFMQSVPASLRREAETIELEEWEEENVGKRSVWLCLTQKGRKLE
jgi:hypothetical protein